MYSVSLKSLGTYASLLFIFTCTPWSDASIGSFKYISRLLSNDREHLSWCELCLFILRSKMHRSFCDNAIKPKRNYWRSRWDFLCRKLGIYLANSKVILLRLFVVDISVVLCTAANRRLTQITIANKSIRSDAPHFSSFPLATGNLRGKQGGRGNPPFFLPWLLALPISDVLRVTVDLLIICDGW